MKANGKRFYQVISADGHVEVPPDRWAKYVPAQWRDRAPRLVKLAEGGEGWIIEGMPMLHNGQNIAAGKQPIKLRNDSYYNPDGSPAPGAGDACQRLREQDQDGIDAEVLFPAVFATSFLEGIKDRPVYRSMVQAYNTFLARDYCSVAPDRLIGSGVMPVTGVDDAVAELKRCKELGLPSVTFYKFPNGGGGPQPEDDRFWQTALDIGMRLSPHLGFGDWRADFGGGHRGTGGAALPAAMCERIPNRPMFCIAQLLYAGVFDRFPAIRFYMAESNASWMPSAMYFFDDNYQLFKDWYNVKLAMRPSEYVWKHCMFSFIRDPMAMKMRGLLPIDNLMWGSDHPHSVCSFPRSREALAEIFAGVPESVRRKVLLENPARFFGLDLKTPITTTPKN